MKLRLGRFKGPFSDAPFDNFKSSPLSIVLKPPPGGCRILHILSYPYVERAVNFNIPESESKLSYASITDAIKIISDNNCKFLCKLDLSEAYRHVKINPDCHNLLGFSFNDEFYYDTRLPMGASSSCRIFEKVSDSLKYALTNFFKVSHVVKLLDDFLFIGKSLEDCTYGGDSFRKLCTLTGFPIAERKTVDPCHALTFLGVHLDTSEVPREKVIK